MVGLHSQTLSSTFLFATLQDRADHAALKIGKLRLGENEHCFFLGGEVFGSHCDFLLKKKLSIFPSTLLWGAE